MTALKTRLRKGELERLSEAQMSRYEDMRAEGASHSMAMMLVLGRAPGCRSTDTRWKNMCGGKGCYQPGIAHRVSTERQVLEGKADPYAYCRSVAEAKVKFRERGLTIYEGPAGMRTGVEPPHDSDPPKKRVRSGKTRQAPITMAPDARE